MLECTPLMKLTKWLSVYIRISTPLTKSTVEKAFKPLKVHAAEILDSCIHLGMWPQLLSMSWHLVSSCSQLVILIEILQSIDEDCNVE